MRWLRCLFACVDSVTIKYQGRWMTYDVTQLLPIFDRANDDNVGTCNVRPYITCAEEMDIVSSPVLTCIHTFSLLSSFLSLFLSARLLGLLLE